MLWNEWVGFIKKFSRGKQCVVENFNIVKKERENKGITYQINRIKM